MKTKVLIPGLLISIALLTFSCTADEYETPNMESGQLKRINEKLDAKTKKAVNQTSNTEIDLLNTDGDPEITRPTRKD
ncbi:MULTISPECIES: hypothetical protein [unclassified Flavobacterium]|uniref:hypothetical protein n=1 Tax=unclassified Flavobacterium TaxID=196869 RepID=UPI002223C39B|nr:MULTISPECIES: hypothetical protein [unclassified Flavobacterium]